VGDEAAEFTTEPGTDIGMEIGSLVLARAIGEGRESRRCERDGDTARRLEAV